MDINNLHINNKNVSFGGLFGVITNDFVINQSCLKERKIFDNFEQFYYQKNNLDIVAEFIKSDEIIVRKDFIVNNSDKTIILSKISSRFAFYGNNYSVFTQRNSWQNENVGSWQKLNTSIVAENFGSRSCAGATPFVSIKDDLSSRVITFNVLPNCRWKIQAKVVPIEDLLFATVVEIGFNDEGLTLELKPGEKLYLPQIYITDGTNSVDFDAYKMQRKWLLDNEKKSLPIIYNSWLYNFDGISFDALYNQAVQCAKLGVEYFVVDAGWFGKELKWRESVGDWEENDDGALCGRLKELSDAVHSLKIKFGLWMEPQRANVNSKAYKENPNFYFDVDEQDKLLDFANAEAREYIFNKTCELIEKYNLDFMKFDYNATACYDARNSAFVKYYEGQRDFFENLRQKYPNLYVSFCASGGQHLDLETFKSCESYWFTDNQGPIDGLRIYKDYVKRVPSFAIEKWLVTGICKNVPIYTQLSPKDSVVYCNNATWTDVTKVTDDYAFEFLKGGPIGFSCDLVSLPNDYKLKLKKFISKYKKERNFFKNAMVKLLIDDENITVLQYFDNNYTKNYIQIFTKKILQDNIIIYPVVSPSKRYKLYEEKVLGVDIMNNGIMCNGIKQNDCLVLELNS